jgi:hypothetical protein
MIARIEQLIDSIDDKVALAAIALWAKMTGNDIPEKRVDESLGTTLRRLRERQSERVDANPRLAMR